MNRGYIEYKQLQNLKDIKEISHSMSQHYHLSWKREIRVVWAHFLHQKVIGPIFISLTRNIPLFITRKPIINERNMNAHWYKIVA